MAPHNLWIEGPLWAQQGDRITCRIFFGHHFHPEGALNPETLVVWMVPPGQDKILLHPEASANSAIVEFTPQLKGTHTILAAYTAGIWSITRDGRHLPGARDNYPDTPVLRTVLFEHFAKTFIPVDEEIRWPGSFGLDLEIVPLSYVGDELELLVQCGGRPLRGAKIYAQNRTEDRSRIARTDAEGKALMILPSGEWAIIAHAQDKPVTEIDRYDERLLTAVLTFRASER
ncbi:MAG: DUF4198 domain-containing protein [Desulfotomaculales bacterium]